MEKKELKEFIRVKFKELGFQKRKDYYTKTLDGDYLIGFYLYPSSYTKGYQFCCGIIYLPNEFKMPFHGLCDLDWNFRFPFKPGTELDFNQDPLAYVFEYEYYTVEQLERIFAQNYERYMLPLYDKEYGLELFRQDWRRLRRHSPQTIAGLCKRMGVDYDEVMDFLQHI